MLTPLASATTTGTGGGLGTMLLLLLPLLLIVFLIVNDRRRRKQMQQLQQSLRVGQEVMTTSGVLGTVVELGDTVVHVQVAPNVVMRWTRPAVMPLEAAQQQLRGRGAPGPVSDEGTGPDDRPGQAG